MSRPAPSPLTHRARPPGTRATALALAGAAALTACSSGGGKGAEGPELEVSGAYMPQPVMSDMTGGFLVVENSGDQDDTLTGVTSDLSPEVEMHKTVNGQMERVRSLPVPADGELALRRGGSHLMFLDLERKPDRGDTVSVTLRFAEHDPITVSVPVKATHHTGAHG